MPFPLAAAAGAYDDDPGAMRRAMLGAMKTPGGGALMKGGGPFGGEIAQTGQGGFQALPEPTVASTPQPMQASAPRKRGGGIGGFLKQAINPIAATRGAMGMLNPKTAMQRGRGVLGAMKKGPMNVGGMLDAAGGYGPTEIRPENTPDRIGARKAAMQMMMRGGGGGM